MTSAPKGSHGADDSSGSDFGTDGDFDLSGFAGDDASAKPAKPVKAKAAADAMPEPLVPGGPKIRGTYKAPPRERAPRRFDGQDPRTATGPDTGKVPGKKFVRNESRDFRNEVGPSRGAGVPRGPRAHSRDADTARGKAGYGPGEGKGPSKFGPRDGGYNRAPGQGPRSGGFDRPPREGGFSGPPREGGFSRGPGQGPREGGFNRPPREGGFNGPRSGGPRSFPPMGPRTVGLAPGAGDHKPVHPDIKPVLPLKTDKGRWKESRFLLEGAKNIADALAVSSGIIQAVYITPEFKDKDLAALLKKNRVQVMEVSEEDLKVISDAETPQPIIAVANFATLRPDWNTARYVTLCDAVQDPGNVGAIFRTSLALGMDAVVLGKGSCDAYNPKVVRSSVGALLRLPFETGEDLQAKMEFLRLKGFSIVATSSHAPITLDKAKLRKKVALIMGNEGAGTGATFLDMADAVVKIPLKNKVESLNVSVAHGILSYQLIHGRA